MSKVKKVALRNPEMDIDDILVMADTMSDEKRKVTGRSEYNRRRRIRMTAQRAKKDRRQNHPKGESVGQDKKTKSSE